jgi:hypothetical protein
MPDHGSPSTALEEPFCTSFRLTWSNSQTCSYCAPQIYKARTQKDLYSIQEVGTHATCLTHPCGTSLLGFKFKAADTGAQQFQYIAPCLSTGPGTNYTLHSALSSSSVVRDSLLQLSLLVCSVMIVGSRLLQRNLGLMIALLIPV